MPTDAISAAPKLGSGRWRNTGPGRRPGCSFWSPHRACTERVVTRTVARCAGPSVRGDRAVHDARIVGVDRVVVDAEPRGGAGRVALHDDIGGGHEAATRARDRRRREGRGPRSSCSGSRPCSPVSRGTGHRPEVRPSPHRRRSRRAASSRAGRQCPTTDRRRSSLREHPRRNVTRRQVPGKVRGHIDAGRRGRHGQRVPVRREASARRRLLLGHGCSHGEDRAEPRRRGVWRRLSGARLRARRVHQLRPSERERDRRRARVARARRSIASSTAPGSRRRIRHST